jgi:hypothetical protein
MDMKQYAARQRRRSASVGRETNRLRGDVAKLLYKGLQDATEAELYNRTPLKVSRAMFRSVSVAMRGNVVEVFYGLGKARHARRRVNMKGRSVSGGHQLDMNPGAWVRKHSDPSIRRIARQALKRVHDVE